MACGRPTTARRRIGDHCRVWRRTARAQGGVVSRSQLRAAGLTDRRIDVLRSRREIEPAGPRGLFVISGAPWTPDRPWWVAVLATAGVLSHLSAARCWNLPVEEDRVHVITSHRARPTGGHDFVVHRVALTGRDVTQRWGLPVTTRPRTVLDCLTSVSEPAARTLLDRAADPCGDGARPGAEVGRRTGALGQSADPSIGQRTHRRRRRVRADPAPPAEVGRRERVAGEPAPAH